MLVRQCEQKVHVLTHSCRRRQFRLKLLPGTECCNIDIDVLKELFDRTLDRIHGIKRGLNKA